MKQAEKKWFEAVANNNLDYVVSKVKKFQNCAETRQTDERKRIFRGFQAIHYAAWFGFDAVLKELLRYEMRGLTNEDIDADCKGMSDVSRYRLAAQSNCLHVALFAGQTKSVEIICEYFSLNSVELYGLEDCDHINPLQQAAIMRFEGCVKVFDCALNLLEQKSIYSSNFGILHICCFFGRLDVLERILRTNEEEQCVNLMIVDDNQRSVYWNANIVIQYQKYNTTAQEKFDCIKLIDSLFKKFKDIQQFQLLKKIESFVLLLQKEKLEFEALYENQQFRYFNNYNYSIQ